MKFSVFLFFSFFFLTSCSKKEGTITGRFLDECGNPLNDYKVQIIGRTSTGSYYYEGEVGSDQTDINGYFSIDYKAYSSSLKLSYYHKDNVIVENIPAKKHINFNDLNKEIIYNLYVRLNVTNPYTSNDTLTVNVEGGEQDVYFEIPGPFTSGIVDSAMNQTYGKFPCKYGEKPQISYYYSSQNNSPSASKKMDINTCNNNEIVISID